MKAKIKIKAKVRNDYTEIPISTEFIKLDSFLKFANAAETGGAAKLMIEDGVVTVNGEICTQRGKKLRPGDIVDADGELFKLTAEVL